MRRFSRFACVDWSGQAVARPKGLAVAWCEIGKNAPTLIVPGGGWSREAILEWLIEHGETGTDMIVGLDLSPALPFADTDAYFPGSVAQPRDARNLWKLVDDTCAGEPHLGASTFADHVDFAPHFRRHGGREGAWFGGGAGRFRAVEHRQRLCGVSPVSCFNLVGAAQVGKSSLTGMRVLHRLAGRVPVWPFDPVPERGPLIVEIYTSIAARAAGVRKGRSKLRDGVSLDATLVRLGSHPHAPLARYDDHSTDAILTAAWLRAVAHDPALWNPPGLDAVRHTEGWTFGAR
ncbi:hypothetical protein [Novosphingobium sp. Gsoil 351]|uniref:hypothetical protein n=1 Tax=Novosphingobium sp. Gsoil 351 TaxID=2675225 RepID=UPI0012B4C402|nr:hypothetical protein [Novosphingobium sp. Gsoil 351]QGN56183.1 hypothetical protein GKE62_18145 [Novosphingobium sp. Gsoil 351]